MGAGKSTLGRQLADDINYEFYDSDKIIVDRTGVDIPTIFDYEGEGGFRKRECEAITELTKEQHIVLATGGGAILNENIRKHLNKSGFVVYLQTTVEEQLLRIGDDKNRPLMQTANPKAKLMELMEQRAPLYEATAHLTFNTNAYKINHISKALLEQIKNNHEHN